MTQAQAVIETIEALGGIATLNQINQNIFKIKDCVWKTKTPFASIRRIVQLTDGISQHPCGHALPPRVRLQSAEHYHLAKDRPTAQSFVSLFQFFNRADYLGSQMGEKAA